MKLRQVFFNAYTIRAALFASLVLYVIVGGLIFRATEHDTKERAINEAREAYKTRIAAWQAARPEEDLEELLSLFEVVQAASDQGVDLRSPDAEVGNVWSLTSASFFAATVMTTIGYGNITPNTTAGQQVFPLYAVLGIALFGVWLAIVGTDLSALITRGEHWLKTRGGLSNKKACFLSVLAFILITVAVCIYSTAGLVMLVEPSWSYGQATYFCWVTSTTVGLGDYVPDVANDWAMLITLVWAFVSLAFVAAMVSYSASFIHMLWVEFCEAMDDVADLIDKYDDKVLGFDVSDALEGMGNAAARRLGFGGSDSESDDSKGGKKDSSSVPAGAATARVEAAPGVPGTAAARNETGPEAPLNTAASSGALPH